MEETIEKKEFSTKDINLAAALITEGFYMIGVDYQQEGVNPRMVGYFTFEDTTELREIEGKYWQGRLLLEPRTFTMNLKALKAQVTNVYKNPNYAKRDQ